MDDGDIRQRARSGGGAQLRIVFGLGGHADIDIFLGVVEGIDDLTHERTIGSGEGVPVIQADSRAVRGEFHRGFVLGEYREGAQYEKGGKQ